MSKKWNVQNGQGLSQKMTKITKGPQVSFAGLGINPKVPQG